MKFYIASKLENAARVKRLAEALKAMGYKHTYDWTKHGSVQCEDRKRLREVAELEARGVADADLVIVILPGGRGTHAELGMAIALCKPVIICAEDEGLLFEGGNTCAFYRTYKTAWYIAPPEKWPGYISAIAGDLQRGQQEAEAPRISDLAFGGGGEETIPPDKLTALNAIEIIDYAVSGSEIEYIHADLSADNIRTLLAAGFEPNAIDEAMLIGGGFSVIDITNLAFEIAGATYWSVKDGFEMEQVQATTEKLRQVS